MLQFSKRFLCGGAAATTSAATTNTTTTTVQQQQKEDIVSSSSPKQQSHNNNFITKIQEINKRVGIISKLEAFEKQLLSNNDDDEKNKNNNSNIINLYSAVVFTPSSQDSSSQRESARFFSQNFTKRLNHEVDIPSCVISIERQTTSSTNRNNSKNNNKKNKNNNNNNNNFPFKFNTRRLYGTVEEARTIKKVNEVITESRSSIAAETPNVKQNIVVFFNDSLVVVPSSSKNSLTYAQNNNVVCAMRRSFEMLESFRHVGSSNNNTAIANSIPPCFFISKLLRSAHMNVVTRIASKYFDQVHLLTLEKQSNATEKTRTMERYLVGEMKPVFYEEEKKNENSKKKISYRDLSLPPDSGEVNDEWMCWGCLQRRDARRMLRCPKCSGI